MSAALADELQRSTRVWLAHPNRRLLWESIRERLVHLTPPPEAAPADPGPDGRALAEVITDPATDLQTWQVAGDVIRDVYPSGVAWTPDEEGHNPGFFYDRSLPYPGGHGLYWHAAGTPQREDACILYQPQHPEHYYQPHISPDGRWLIVSVLNGSANNLLYLFAVGRTVSPTYSPLISRFTGRYDPLHWRNDELICRAVEPDAPNGQLIAFRLDPPHPRRTILPPGDLPLLDAAPLGDGWVVSYLNGGASELRWLGGEGATNHTLPLPGLGTVEWLETAPEVGLLPEVRLLFAYTDCARPRQAYTWQPGDPQPQTAADAPDLPFDPTHFVTRRAWATSADGAQIPLFLAHRRDVTPADRPTLLHAYGGLGVSLTPHFSADALAWMEMGGVYATVCARGGGEGGAAWHRAAVGVHKQRTFDDVLAAAHWLAAEGVASPARLGLWGASNGGLTAGACLTQQPELFGAVVIESGLLDMLHYHRLGQGAGWLAEYGNPDDPDERIALAAYSPLHNIRPGRAYPPTLLVTHSHDPRVGEGHSLAFAQELAAAQGSDVPILLRVHPGSGHSPADNGWAAERLAFLAEYLGLVERTVSPPATEKE